MPGSAIAAQADGRGMTDRSARPPPVGAAPITWDMALILLALAAGCVDGVSFLGLGQVLTAAMTGNTVLLGLALGQGDVPGALHSIMALLGFFAGVLFGAALVERRVVGSIRSLAVALAVEVVVLVVVALTWQLAEGTVDGVGLRLLLIAAAGLAMGVQSAIAYRIGVAGIATTYVTGTLTTLAARLVGWFRSGGPGAGPARQAASWVPAAVWLAYGAGAAFAGATHVLWPALVGGVGWPTAALALPIVLVAAVALGAGPCQGRAAAG